MPCKLFCCLFHFTPTCFGVRDVIFSLPADVKKTFCALPEDDVPYVETRIEVKNATKQCTVRLFGFNIILSITSMHAISSVKLM
jgi:hypothetical protein